jgi:ATP-dependent DNA helicase RecQ
MLPAVPPAAAMPVLTPDAPEVSAALRRHFGFDALRPGQDEALAPVLEGRDTLVVMPTGAGKSLVYQLAAVLGEGVTVVVSPLIALMKDQVDGLAARGVPAVAVHSAMPESAQRAALELVARGAVRMVYVAPERLRTRGLLRALDEVGVGRLAVDEAHCVSQWGHDFRPDYRALADARVRMGDPPCVALTATATPRVQDDIAASLGLRAPARVVTGFNRPNLRFVVRNAPGQKEKRQALLDLVAQHDGEAGLIYVSTRKEAESLAGVLAEKTGRAVGTYHAGLPDEARTDVQDRFIGRTLDLVVATNAFGMGVDRPDVRFVAHWSLPATLEAYYQEAGRGGRDGRDAEAVLLYAPQDSQLREWFIEQNAPDEGVLRALYRAAERMADEGGLVRAEPDTLAVAAKQHPIGGRVALALLERAGALDRLDDQGQLRVWRLGRWDAGGVADALEGAGWQRRHKTEELARLVTYAQTDRCRRRLILDHFGDDTPLDLVPERCCDACAARARLKAAPDEIPGWDELPMASRIALGLLDAVRRQKWPVGRRTLAKILAGSKAEGMARYERHPYYGRLQTYGQDAIDGFYKQLLLAGYLRVAGGDMPIVELTALGRQAVEHREAIALELPGGGAAASRASSAGGAAVPEALTGDEEALFQRLRAWRAEQARAQEVPPYVVFDDKTLRAVAVARPADEDALLAVKGVGPAKLEKYGAEVLRIVAEG